MSVTWEYVHLTKLQSETFSIKPPLLGAKRGGTESFALFSRYTQPAFSKIAWCAPRGSIAPTCSTGREKKETLNYVLCTEDSLYDMEYWVCWCVLEDDMLFDLQLLMKKKPKTLSLNPSSLKARLPGATVFSIDHVIRTKDAYAA